MNRYHARLVAYLIVFLLLVIVPACGGGPSAEEEGVSPDSASPVVPGAAKTEPARQSPAPPEEAPMPAAEPGREAEEPPPSPVRPPVGPEPGKWALWVDGPHLRGANIYQRRVYPELDGPEFMGPGPLGPPYTQEDFDRLAALGANYVNVSHPGLFSETPPYRLDEAVQENLDRLLDMIAQADMFAVISFRTGPGRAEFSVCCLEEAGDWYDESYLNDAVWQDAEAQEAWAAMWRYTAERYRDYPNLVGYDLMVEPNSNEVWLDLWEPEEFYADYGGSLYDWNQLYPRISTAIREVDPDTPIIVGGMAYSAVDWLPYLEPTGDSRTVYAAHQYAPVQYTHQWLDSLEFTYPGTFDTDWDGADDQVDRAWLDDLLSAVDDFAETHGVPIAVNEFGPMRWQPGAAQFVDDHMALLEARGINHALWVWDPAWEPQADNDAFNFRHGPDPGNHADVASSELMDVIVSYWGRNAVRPSNAAEELAAPAEIVKEPVTTPEATDETGDMPIVSLIEDFEGGDFEDRWWSYTGGGSTSFACALDQPGHDSTHALRLTFEVSAEGYAGCGIDVDPDGWGDAQGLSFFWRADQPGLPVTVALDMEDPTQTNPEAEGVTSFGAELQTPGEAWTQVVLTWDAFAKAEWVGEGGVDVLDPRRVVALYFEVSEEQSGSAWFDDLQLAPTEGPPTATPVAARQPPEMTDGQPRALADVSHWLYLIDVNLEPEVVDRIAASSHDMVVLDFIPSEKENTDYPMAEVVSQLHDAQHRKLVIAYIDTGQAEEYRTYWQPGWGIGDPEWIVGADPDGWEGNFPVAYWDDEWREIWLGEKGYLQAILDAGFDGVYLDWVEAYSDESVVAFAGEDGVDPRQEMIWWVEDIADYARAQRPDFVVIAQNAAELAEDDDYLAAIDAIAQEQIWFDGGADNDPPGDCPLPRTDAEVDTPAYRSSLSPPCRQQYDDYPDSTLHVSSQEYLSYLIPARDRGVIIFSVDYALEPENVSWVYETSRGLGFVPFVGTRALDRYIKPVP